jgi:hypothetical protein
MALSSVSLATWVILWAFKIIREKDTSAFRLLFRRYKYVLISITVYIIIEIISRIFAVFPEDALLTIKRYLLLLVFFANPVIIKTKEGILKYLTIILFIAVMCRVVQICG